MIIIIIIITNYIPKIYQLLIPAFQPEASSLHIGKWTPPPPSPPPPSQMQHIYIHWPHVSNEMHMLHDSSEWWHYYYYHHYY